MLFQRKSILRMILTGFVLVDSQELINSGFPGLFIADRVTFPILPAKNNTFTLMPNASRIVAGLDR